MPPKKRNQTKGQPSIVTFIAHDSQQLDSVGREKRLERQAEKLLKLRRQIEQRKREEERLMKVILRLQITDDKANKEQVIENDMEYWVRTSEASFVSQNSSLLKMVLQDYGEVQTQRIKGKELQKPEIQMMAQQETQWRQKGVLNPAYLSEYACDFLASLKEYQYLSDDLNQP